MATVTKREKLRDWVNGLEFSFAHVERMNKYGPNKQD